MRLARLRRNCVTRNMGGHEVEVILLLAEKEDIFADGELIEDYVRPGGKKS